MTAESPDVSFDSTVKRHGRSAVVGLVVVALLAAWGGPSAAQEPAASREVRQLVTFRFLPGQARTVQEIYRSLLVPIYREIDAVRHVRVFGEVESPEPLDLMVMTHYADMAAMDRANQDLRRPVPDRSPVSLIYERIANASLSHHDQFVEVISSPNVAPAPDGTLEILEFLQVRPEVSESFERQTLAVVHAWEQEPPIRDIVVRSETARFLVADGWTYLRSYSVRNLAAWQAYATARGRHPAVSSVNRMVAARKTLILRELPDLRVR